MEGKRKLTPVGKNLYQIPRLFQSQKILHLLPPLQNLLDAQHNTITSHYKKSIVDRNTTSTSHRTTSKCRLTSLNKSEQTSIFWVTTTTIIIHLGLNEVPKIFNLPQTWYWFNKLIINILPSLVCHQYTVVTVTNKRSRKINTNTASPSKCEFPRPHQSLFHFIERHEVPSLKCIGLTGRFEITSSNLTSHYSTSARNTRCPLWSTLDLRDRYLPTPPHQSLFYFSEKHEVPSLKCFGFTGPLINIYYSRLSRNERYHSKIPPTPQITNEEPPILLLWLEYVITISHQMHTHDFSGTNDNHTIRKFHPRRKWTSSFSHNH